ncbi:hypothetical protein [Pantoea eucrina]|uniref:hypothetical protein n=1 Tax=Pantoea eucrina TaxID=472693 RepID=UPI001FCCD898|nr:hypothetical protein [Pantoea eucrina]
MKIACLAWGSLIWKPGELPVAGEWHADGPALPVEFCRIGDGGELATALCMNAAPVNVYWAVLASVSLPEAVAALRLREAIPDEREDGVAYCCSRSIRRVCLATGRRIAALMR